METAIIIGLTFYSIIITLVAYFLHVENRHILNEVDEAFKKEFLSEN